MSVKGASRKGDRCTGHGKYKPRPCTQGSPNVMINGRPAHRKGDAWASHCNNSCHPSVLANGSPTVLVNGKQQGRIGDPVACKSKVATGSSDVFVGTSSFSSSLQNSVYEVPVMDESLDGSQGGTQPYYGSPGGGGTPYSEGGFVNSASGYAMSENEAESISVEPDEDGCVLGSLSKRYESGSKGPAAIGYDRVGGWSYGTYQIAARTGTFKNFMAYLRTNNPDIHSELESVGGNDAASRGDAAFQQKWQSLAQTNQEFANSQHDFIQATHYDKYMRKLKSDGIDLSSRSCSVKDALWSIAVQHGSGNKIVHRALEGRDISSLSDADIINLIYDERSAKTPGGQMKYFANSTPAVQASVSNRFNDERNTALSRLA